MFKEQFEKIKALVVKKEGGNDKRKIENLVVFLIILIVTIVAINIIWKDEKESSNNTETTNTTKQLAVNNIDDTKATNYETDDLKKNLEEILSKIDGVGNVSVLITYSKTSSLTPMYNEDTKTSLTEETDTSGGTRLIEQNDVKKEVIYKEENGEKIPVTQNVIMPKIEGAIVTASGAGSATVKTNIIQAVEAVTGLATHKIQVFEMSK